jgi:hypothetical protein
MLVDVLLLLTSQASEYKFNKNNILFRLNNDLIAVFKKLIFNFERGHCL